MISQENRLFCRLDGITVEAREQQRTQAIAKLGLLQTDSVPVFEEAIQAAAQSLEMPICLLSLMEADQQRIKAAVGLSCLGLMNPLASSRQIPRLESFCAHVVDSHQMLAIANAIEHPAFSSSSLVHQYGIQAYLGVPLITSDGQCIGTLAVMDTAPHQFNPQDAAFLQLMARWSISEFERQRLAIPNLLPVPTVQTQLASSLSPEKSAEPFVATELRVELLSQLAQELRTPLTSVIGMASVLTRELYGPLTTKQKEYLNIIHNSGQYLLSLMNEIVELSEFKSTDQRLTLTSVDVESLCQQAINTLEQAAQRREIQIRLTLEPGAPGRRIWLMDKEKGRQMLYHLLFSVIQSSTQGSIVRLHVSRRDNTLNLAIWVSHPWLGEGLPYAELYAQPSLVSVNASSSWEDESAIAIQPTKGRVSVVDGAIHPEEADEDLRSMQEAGGVPQDPPRKNLGFMLSQYLAELHGGQVSVQGVTESSYRYVVHLPRLSEQVDA
jgi:K+-sensing histidine kinase KdpD